MKSNETIEQRARQTVRFTIQKNFNDLRMTSTTGRYPLKPKTLTLLELCESMGDFRRPPPAISSYQYQSSQNIAQSLTRRLYLHPITLNPNSKQQSSKRPTTTSTTPPGSDQRSQINSEKNREIHHTKTKSSHTGLAVLSSSFPLTTRSNSKPDTRHSRDKISTNTDDETNSDYDASSTTISLNQSSLPLIARGTSSSTRTICTRPACIMNHRKTYDKSKHWPKVNVWHHLDRALARPIPIDPPTTPLIAALDLNIENHEPQKHYLNNSSIQEIKIYKRNRTRKLTVSETDDNDNDYMYTEN